MIKNLFDFFNKLPKNKKGTEISALNFLFKIGNLAE